MTEYQLKLRYYISAFHEEFILCEKFRPVVFKNFNICGNLRTKSEFLQNDMSKSILFRHKIK